MVRDSRTGGAFLAFAIAEMLWGAERAIPLRLYEAGGDLRELTGTGVVIVNDAIDAGSAALADPRRRGTPVAAAAALLGPLCRRGRTLIDIGS